MASPSPAGGHLGCFRPPAVGSVLRGPWADTHPSESLLSDLVGLWTWEWNGWVVWSLFKDPPNGSHHSCSVADSQQPCERVLTSPRPHRGAVLYTRKPQEPPCGWSGRARPAPRGPLWPWGGVIGKVPSHPCPHPRLGSLWEGWLTPNLKINLSSEDGTLEVTSSP